MCIIYVYIFVKSLKVYGMIALLFTIFSECNFLNIALMLEKAKALWNHWSMTFVVCENIFWKLLGWKGLETFHLIQFFQISLNVWIVHNSFNITLKIEKCKKIYNNFETKIHTYSQGARKFKKVQEKTSWNQINPLFLLKLYFWQF